MLGGQLQDTRGQRLKLGCTAGSNSLQARSVLYADDREAKGRALGRKLRRSGVKPL